MHHAKCIYNALSDIKPEVENVIKMGRKIVETEAETDSGSVLTEKIDLLKKDFNEVGAQITEAKKSLESALGMSEKLEQRMDLVQSWMTSVMDSDLSNRDSMTEKLAEMTKLKDRVLSIYDLTETFIELGKGSPMTELKESIRALESRWAKILIKLEKANKAPLQHLALNTGKKPEMQADEGGEQLLVREFRGQFQQTLNWIENAEARLTDLSRTSEERTLPSQELDEWKVKIYSLRSMADRLVTLFSGHKSDVEPEMRALERRWDAIVRQVELKKLQSPKIQANSSNEQPLVQEFRIQYQHTLNWIENAESRLADLNRASEERTIPKQELERWKPQVDSLRSTAEKLVSLFTGHRANVEPEMRALDHRWDLIVKQVELKMRQSQSFKVVEVEEIKTTISEMQIPKPTLEDDDETINTLPEDEESSPLKRRLSPLDLNSSNEGLKKAKQQQQQQQLSPPANSQRESSLLSSRESSPDLEVVTGTMILSSNSPTFIRETVSKVRMFTCGASPGQCLSRIVPVLYCWRKSFKWSHRKLIRPLSTANCRSRHTKWKFF